MSIILITGAATGIGNLSAKALARAGHSVFASMRDPEGRNAPRAQELRELATSEYLDLRALELDVQSQDSADDAVKTVIDRAGRLDVVLHNAGHMSIGYVEAFTIDDLQHQFDINTFSVQRVNRAALPYLRAQRSGTLLYIGSTTSVNVPPFLGPYVAAKAAFDSLAQVTAYEVAPFGIETTILMPGPFTHGTEHFPNASHPSDDAVTAQYTELDPLIERYGEATSALFPAGVDADPQAVADEVVRILALPVGQKPVRSLVDFTGNEVEVVNKANRKASEDYLIRMGYPDLLQVKA